MAYKLKCDFELDKAIGTVAELFAGVGGFRFGLGQAGWQTVFSNQWEPSTTFQHASEVYVRNFGSLGHSNEDIHLITEIPVHVDLLVGGFPCQDYSVARSASSATGLEGQKGVLWWEILRLLGKNRPKFVFLENVDRLLKSPSSQRGRDFAVMLSTLAREGYFVEWRVINAADYGQSQRRKRVFIVGIREDFVEPSATPDEVIHKTGVLARAFPAETVNCGIHEIPIGDNPVEVSREFNSGNTRSPFAQAGVMTEGAAFTTPVIPRFSGRKYVLSDVLVPDESVPDEFWVPKSQIADWKYVKGAKQISRTDKRTGFEYFYSEGAMSFPDPTDQPSRTILTGEGGQYPSRFKHVVKTDRGYRRLVPLELERLTGFPDDWTRFDLSEREIKPSRRAFLLGNAVITDLVRRVGIQLAANHSQN